MPACIGNCSCATKKLISVKCKGVAPVYVVNYAEANVNFEEGTTPVIGRTRSGRVASQDTTKQSPEKVRNLS